LTIHGLKSSSGAHWNKEQFDVIGFNRHKDSLGPVTRIDIEDEDTRATVHHFEVQPVDG
jgi:hypothetical protein